MAWRPYRDVLRASIAFAMVKVGLTADAQDTGGIILRLSRIAAHPEVPAALAELKKRYRLAAISNTDDDIIAGSLPSLGIALDAVITAQQAKAYKPDPHLFHHAHEMLGVTPRDMAHVAMSQGLDMAMCKVLGIRTFGADRGRERAEDQ